MDCEICLELLDAKAHLPKVLSCGHTVCLQCLQRLPQRQCPTCMKAFAGKPDDLASNFKLLNMIERSAKQKAKLVGSQQWCLDCCKLANDVCVGKHRHSDPHAALQQHFQPLDVKDWQIITASLSDKQAVSALQLLSPANPYSARAVTLSSEGQAPLGWKVSAGREEGTAAAARVKDRILSALTVIMVRETGQDRVAILDGTLKKQCGETRIESLDVSSLTYPQLMEKKEEKAALLGRVREHGVKKLTGVHCQRDPDWCLELLETAAPFLEQLEVEWVSAGHIMALLIMPRLRRLVIVGNTKLLNTGNPPRLPLLCAPKLKSLQWLEVRDLPLDTVKDLLLDFRASLQVLVLWVGCGDHNRDSWPDSYKHIEPILVRAGLWALRKVFLQRERTSCFPTFCNNTRKDIQTKLPGVVALCSVCNKDKFKDM